jgi:hypothetical protein
MIAQLVYKTDDITRVGILRADDTTLSIRNNWQFARGLKPWGYYKWPNLHGGYLESYET